MADHRIQLFCELSLFHEEEENLLIIAKVPVCFTCVLDPDPIPSVLRDPGSGTFSGIRDGKNPGPGSGMNIPNYFSES